MKTEPAIEPVLRTPWQARLIRDMQIFHSETGMKYSTIGARGGKNARIWERLEAGGTVTLEIADMIYDWMATQGYHFNS